MSAPAGPDRVPTDNPAFLGLVSSITTTMRQHRAVPRGKGQVGRTCRHPLCREPIFLTVGDGANHQSFEVIRTIRIEAGYLLEGDDPEDAQALANLLSLLNLDTVSPEPQQ